MISFSAALLIFAAPALSPAEMQALEKASFLASQENQKCQNAQIAKLPTATPEAVAAAIFSACAAEREANTQASNRSVDALFPPKVAAEMKKGLDRRTEKRIASLIRVNRAMKANSDCVNSQVEKLAATVTPEAGASTIYSACATTREASLKTLITDFKESPSKMDEWKSALIAQFKAQIANDPREVAAAKEELADKIRQQRSKAKAPVSGATPAKTQ